MAIQRLALAFRRSAGFVRMLCVLFLAIASVLHVAEDFRASNVDAGQAAVSSAADDPGAHDASTAEACHSCSVTPYFNAVSPLHGSADAHGVPDGRLVRMSVVSLRIAGPPPKS